MELEFNIYQVVFTIIKDSVIEGTIIEATINGKGVFYTLKVKGYTDFYKTRKCPWKNKGRIKKQII